MGVVTTAEARPGVDPGAPAVRPGTGWGWVPTGTGEHTVPSPPVLPSRTRPTTPLSRYGVRPTAGLVARIPPWCEPRTEKTLTMKKKRPTPTPKGEVHQQVRVQGRDPRVGRADPGRGGTRRGKSFPHTVEQRDLGSPTNPLSANGSDHNSGGTKRWFPNPESPDPGGSPTPGSHVTGGCRYRILDDPSKGRCVDHPTKQKKKRRRGSTELP